MTNTTDDEDRVALLAEPMVDSEELGHVGEVKPGERLVEEVEIVLLIARRLRPVASFTRSPSPPNSVVIVVGIATGLPEELIFRGVLQTATRPILGRQNWVYVSLVFAVLHIGYQSPLDLVFVFGVGLLYGWVFERSRSIVGVSIGHGLVNMILFFVAPNLPARSRPGGPGDGSSALRIDRLEEASGQVLVWLLLATRAHAPTLNSTGKPDWPT